MRPPSKARVSVTWSRSPAGGPASGAARGAAAAPSPSPPRPRRGPRHVGRRPGDREPGAVLAEVADAARAERQIGLDLRAQGRRVEDLCFGVVAGVDEDRQPLVAREELGDGGGRRVGLDVARQLAAALGVEGEQQGLLAAAIGCHVDPPPVGREAGVVDRHLPALRRVELARLAGLEVEEEQGVLGPGRDTDVDRLAAVAAEARDHAEDRVGVDAPRRRSGAERLHVDRRRRLGMLAGREDHAVGHAVGDEGEVPVEPLGRGELHRLAAGEVEPVDRPVLVGAAVGLEEERAPVRQGHGVCDPLAGAHQPPRRRLRLVGGGEVELRQAVAVRHEEDALAVPGQRRAVVGEGVEDRFDDGRQLPGAGVRRRRRVRLDPRRDLRRRLRGAEGNAGAQERESCQPKRA